MTSEDLSPVDAAFYSNLSNSKKRHQMSWEKIWTWSLTTVPRAQFKCHNQQLLDVGDDEVGILQHLISTARQIVSCLWPKLLCNPICTHLALLSDQPPLPHITNVSDKTVDALTVGSARGHAILGFNTHLTDRSSHSNTLCPGQGCAKIQQRLGNDWAAKLGTHPSA